MAAPQAWEWGPDPPWHAWKFYCPAFTLWPPVLQEFHFQVLSVLACLMLWKKNGHTEQQDCSKKNENFHKSGCKEIRVVHGSELPGGHLVCCANSAAAAWMLAGAGAVRRLAPGWQGHAVWSFLPDGVLEVKAGGAALRVRVSCCICSRQSSLDAHNKHWLANLVKKIN